MQGNVGRTIPDVAQKQWEDFYRIISSRADVELIDPAPGLPDMVFTANSGLILDNDVVLSHFAYHQRQPEEPLSKQWFETHSYNVHNVPPDLMFEGAGDALFDSDGRKLWAAYGNRTSLEAHPFLAAIFNMEVLSLMLTDPRFYHLDTCFLPLPDGYLLYYPEALDTRSNGLIEKTVPAEKRIVISNDNAVAFAANAVSVGRTVIMNRCFGGLRNRLESCGFEVIETDLSEFMKAGGSAKCLTLLLTATAPEKRAALSTVATRKLVAEGQLIDSQLMSRICDGIVEGGGSFRIHSMHLGQKRNELSTVEIEVAAPAGETLERLVQKIIRLGARLPLGESSDARLDSVTQDGVAPDNFYSTTIYRTQVRVGGKWLDVAGQRMDGVIVVSDGSARCELLRKLKARERVVTGGEGIRVMQPVGEAGRRDQFGFMASGISSERRVEIAVERIAWEMNRIRNNEGRIVVVAGPVVNHTGGALHLAWLVRNGYMNALLGGNAIAAHDIEEAMFGTSLGVDLKTGRLVEGGHRNHIAAINRIRRAGSISAAVEKEELESGLFYELIKNKIPFSLAGSIRDDGPIPETEMDLIKAQEDYARLIKEADMILMLASMLHAIGTGNMTPAGVKLVCVDINPAVVTKLTDRGSLESIGIVTDVGLFLSQLVKRLEAFS
jgi:lysine-ketoglutarate reductase/saccharopine dehydrogenase-like protein (TIGR00300 family)